MHVAKLDALLVWNLRRVKNISLELIPKICQH